MTQIGQEQGVGLDEKIAQNRPLTVKIGFDPTAPDLHLGHYIVLRGAKKLQDLGHNVVVIVGDFTASIGDPSGRNKLRPPLDRAAIDANAQTYMDQVFMVLDKEKTTVRRNSEWLEKMDFRDVLSLLSSVTLSQMLARDDFKKRHDAQAPIFMHEMAYPLMQGLDSVKIKADVELGGTDQTFNLMMGRELQKSHSMGQQAVVTFPLLVGLDGVKKMSKSLGNHIGLMDAPSDKFGKMMSVSDDTMWKYLVVLMEKTPAEVEALQASGRNPKEIKMDLAAGVVELFHGPEAAAEERAKFVERFSNRSVADAESVEVQIESPEIGLGHLVKFLEFAKSISEANRKIEQNGVKLDGSVVADRHHKMKKGDEFLLQVGKLHVKKVKLK